MTEFETQECSTAVVVGLARTFFPIDGEMLHLLGLLQNAKPGDFDVALKQVCAYGEDRYCGFATTVDRQVKAAIKEIEAARKSAHAR